MRKSKQTETVNTFLGFDASIEGTIEFKGTIRLYGRVKGKIFSSSGTLIVGEKAVVDADIDVDIAIIMGQVNGVINAKNRIEVYPPGSITGDIQAPVVSIDAGVRFNGNCSMDSGPTVTVKSTQPPKALSVVE